MKFIVKKRTATEIFKETWSSFFALLVPLIVAGGVCFLSLRLFSFLLVDLTGVVDFSSGSYGTKLLLMYGLSMPFYSWFQIFVVQYAGKKYLNQEIRMKDIVLRCFRLTLPVAVVAFAGAMISVAGLFLLFVPGILGFLILSFVITVYILEGSSLPGAFKRGGAMIKGYLSRLTGIGVLLALSLLPVLVLAGFQAEIAGRIPAGVYSYVAFFSSLIIIFTLISIFSIGALQIYLSRRAELEELDIELMVDDFDQSDEDNEPSAGMISG